MGHRCCPCSFSYIHCQDPEPQTPKFVMRGLRNLRACQTSAEHCLTIQAPALLIQAPFILLAYFKHAFYVSVCFFYFGGTLFEAAETSCVADCLDELGIGGAEWRVLVMLLVQRFRV